MSIASGCRAGALTRAAGSSAGCFCISTSMTTILRMLKLRDATFRGNGSRPLLFMTLTEDFRKDSSLCLRIISTDFYTLYLEGNVYCDGRWHNIRL